MLRRLTGNVKGMTLVEILVGMVIFATGLLALSRVMFQTMHSNLASKNTVVATNLAHQKMEQIIGSTRYGVITQTNFPTEDYEQIEGGNEEFERFRRVITIADSLNALGTSVIKEITVRVEWREAARIRNVELKSSISRFKDISL